MSKDKKAFILAGGTGTRLRPYTYVIPKPLLPIGDRPILEHILERLKASGISEVILSVGYRSSYVKAFFGDGESQGLDISYVSEEIPLGTCGPVALAEDKIEDDEYFLLMNGDIYTELDFKKFLEFARQGSYELVVGTIEKEEVSRFGVLKVKEGLLQEVVEKPRTTSTISAGIYVLKGSVLRHVPKGEFFTVPDLMQTLMSQNIPVATYPIQDYWIGIEYIDDLNAVIERLKV